MLIKRSALEIFKSAPDLDRIPAMARRPSRKQEVFIRPPLSLPGVAITLIASPSRKAVFNHLTSKLLLLELSNAEREMFSTLANLEILRGTARLEILSMLELLAKFSSKSLPLEGRLWMAKLLADSNLLSFLPSLAIARNEVEVHCVRRWYKTPRVILPQRKRGYDDKGNLAPPDSIRWQEVALANADDLSISEAELSTLVDRLRTAWGARTDETPLVEIPKVETLISKVYERFRK